MSAAAAKSLQSCPTLCNPKDSSPPDSSVYGILQARILEWVAISFSICIFVSFAKLGQLLLLQILLQTHPVPPLLPGLLW